MFFKFTGQAFLIPAAVLALGFFVLYASSRVENKLENKGIKLYAFFTISLLWVCATFLLLGGILDTSSVAMPTEGESQRSMPIPMPPEGYSPHESTPPSTGDDEMSLNPDATGETLPEGMRSRGRKPYLRNSPRGMEVNI